MSADPSPSTTARSKALVLAAFVAVFCLGTVTGAAAWHVISRRTSVDLFDAAAQGSRHGVFVWSLDRKLGLSSDQTAAIERILADYDRDAAAITPAPDPRLKALRAQMRAEIRNQLDAKQAARFDSLMDDLDAVRQRSRSSTSPSATPSASNLQNTL